MWASLGPKTFPKTTWMLLAKAIVSKKKIPSIPEKEYLRDTMSSTRRRKSTCTTVAIRKERSQPRPMRGLLISKCLEPFKFKTKSYMRTRMSREKTETCLITTWAPIAKRTRVKTKILLANSINSKRSKIRSKRIRKTYNN